MPALRLSSLRPSEGGRRGATQQLCQGRQFLAPDLVAAVVIGGGQIGALRRHPTRLFRVAVGGA